MVHVFNMGEQNCTLAFKQRQEESSDFLFPDLVQLILPYKQDLHSCILYTALLAALVRLGAQKLLHAL